MLANPVVGLAVTPKSSNRSRLPVHPAPLWQTAPKWTTGVGVDSLKLEPAVVAVRFCANPTVHAAVDGKLEGFGLAAVARNGVL
jgi:hypothetical protein